MTPTGSDPGFERSTKKVKLGSHESGVGSSSATKHEPEKKKTRNEKNTVPEVVNTKVKSGDKGAGKDKKKKKRRATETVVSEGEDEGEAVEDNEQTPPPDSEEDKGEYVPPVHESLARAAGPNSASSSKKNRKHVPPDETPDQRDSRTVFVGNVPSQVMATKVSWRFASLARVNCL